jgi:hypothetical protein
MLKIAFAGQADHAREPVRVLTGLNRSLCDKFDAHFVTAAYLYVDLEKRLLHYAAAAHPPLLLISGAAHKVSEIEENGLALGIFPESVYSSVEIRVCPGDRCLLYTDGILEPRTLPRNSSASHAAKIFWKRNAKFRPRVSPTLSSTASPVLRALTRRTTTLPSSCWIFKRSPGESQTLSSSANFQVGFGGVQIGKSIVTVLGLGGGGKNCSFQANVQRTIDWLEFLGNVGNSAPV